MLSSTVALRRFWYPRSTPPSLEGGTGGYLNDVERISPLTNQQARGDERTLEELSRVPCLFLLGEMGLGKSEEVRVEVARLRSVLPPEQVLHVELGAYRSETDLRTQVLVGITRARQPSSGR